MALTYRIEKGSELTYEEGDGNIKELDDKCVANTTDIATLDAGVEANTKSISNLAGASGQFGNTALDLTLTINDVKMTFDVVVASSDTELLAFDDVNDTFTFKKPISYNFFSEVTLESASNQQQVVTFTVKKVSDDSVVATNVKTLNIPSGDSINVILATLIENPDTEVAYYVTAKCDGAYIIKTINVIISAGSSGGSGATGLEAIDEGNGIGWRLIGLNPDKYGNLGLNSITVMAWGYGGDHGDPVGATGESSACIGGKGNTASALASACIGGYANISSGESSTCIGGSDSISSDYNASCLGGHRSVASGYASLVLGGEQCTVSGVSGFSIGGEECTVSGASGFSIGGYMSQVTGDSAFIIGCSFDGIASGYGASCIGGGENLTATSKYSVVTGKNNGYNATVDNEDVLFVVGNGVDSDNRANALEVRTDGGIKASQLPTTAPTETGMLWNNAGVINIS